MPLDMPISPELASAFDLRSVLQMVEHGPSDNHIHQLIVSSRETARIIAERRLSIKPEMHLELARLLEAERAGWSLDETTLIQWLDDRLGHDRSMLKGMKLAFKRFQDVWLGRNTDEPLNVMQSVGQVIYNLTSWVDDLDNYRYEITQIAERRDEKSGSPLQEAVALYKIAIADVFGSKVEPEVETDLPLGVPRARFYIPVQDSLIVDVEKLLDTEAKVHAQVGKLNSLLVGKVGIDYISL